MVGKSIDPRAGIPERFLDPFPREPGEEWGRGGRSPEGAWRFYDYPRGYLEWLELQNKRQFGWAEIWDRLDLIEQDLQDAGLDLSSSVVDPVTQQWRPILQVRSARWLIVRVVGLLSKPTRLQSSLNAWLDEEDAKAAALAEAATQHG